MASRLCPKTRGFSLTEVLLAVATIAVGMLFIGGAFLLGVHYSVFTTEQTVAGIVAREAVTTIQLRGVYNASLLGVDRQTVYTTDRQGIQLTVDERLYPQIKGLSNQARQYYWQALVMRDQDDPCCIIATVFICRLVSGGYLGQNGQIDFPEPLMVSLSPSGKGLTPDRSGLIYDGGLLVRDKDGLICRPGRLDGTKESFTLSPERIASDASGSYWLISPPADKGKDPTLAVYQTRIWLTPPTGGL